MLVVRYRTLQLTRTKEVLEEQIELRVTQLRSEKDKLENANVEILEQKKKVEEATRAKSDFLAMMSHEIRTPMNGVIGMTALLMDTQLGLEQKRFVETIRTSGENMMVLINDIIDFSKIESGKLDLDVQPMDLDQCLDDTITILAARSSEKKLELLYEIAPEVPRFIAGDLMRIRQILVNLVGNSIKFTEKGEIFVMVKLEKREGENAILHFAVRDTGIGISEENANTLSEYK